jgi:signal transduction histidine kinase
MSGPPTGLIFKMILGTLGFIAVLALTVLLFIKLLHEMRLNQLQSEFLATISHELKTPIAALELSSSLLRSGGISESERNRLWSTHRLELKRLREEVEALLEAAKWQSKPNLMQKRIISVESWIRDSLPHWKQILGTESILTYQSTALFSQACLDIRSLNLIADNLISNAKKFSKGTPHVVVRTLRIPKEGPFSKTKWRVEFEDYGWGFSPTDSEKIFHRFFRSKNPAPYAIAGTGLGLYLAREASRAMGLTLRAQSKGTGNGAIFILEGVEHLK